MWSYITESSIWSLGGLFVGYMLGRTEREVRHLIAKEDEETPHD